MVIHSCKCFAASSVFERLNWTEIRPAAIQTESILADEPMGRPVIDVDAKDLWVNGKRFLWRWSLTDGAVTRWDQPPARNEPFQLIYAGRSLLIGVDKKSAWILKGEKKATWKKLDGSFPPACIPMGASLLPYDNSHRIYFLNNCGIFLVLLDPGQLLKTVGSTLEVEGGQPKLFAQLPGDNSVLTTKDQSLLLLTMDGPRLRESEVYRAKSKLKGVTKSGSFLLTWTSQAIIVFDEKLKRKQVVPVLGNRKIKSFGASATSHVLGFTDGAVEVMDLTSGRKFASERGEYTPNFIDVFSDESLVVLSFETGLPRVFKFAPGNGVTPSQ
jgi:hypothetical protein